VSSKRIVTIYALLALAWLLFVIWQVFEHSRIKQAARDALLSRAQDISSSLGVVIRSQGRFGIIRQSRLQDALEDLVQSKELQAVTLLNASGQAVASAGETIDAEVEDLFKNKDKWTDNSVVILNLVDLGASTGDRSTTRPAPIVLDRPDGRRPDFRDRHSTPTVSTEMRRHEPRPPFPDRDSSQRTRAIRRFGRPPWISEERYQELLEKQGLHSFIIQMSTSAFKSESRRDLWLRTGLCLIALLAAIGLGIAWRNADRSARLQMRLLKASEMNAYLREMNVAAAGLAHETKNPLNVVRGQAQIISQDKVAPEIIRSKARGIIEEVDRVTGRLNEFINYSKPPQLSPTSTNLKTVMRDVERTLETDMADKDIKFEMKGADLNVQADESLLRQVLFNLLLNSIQAVDYGGSIKMVITSEPKNEATVEFRDNGYGVPPDARENIFRPYFTSRKGGTGLGLAVVRQIVLAHQWEIEYIPLDKGSLFRISGMIII
jgi:signal transduction histidine kinase